MRRRHFAASAAVVVALAWPPMVRAAATQVAPADVARPAQRDVPWVPGATCDTATAQALAARHWTTRQFVIVSTDVWDTSTATLQIVARSMAGEWRCQLAPVTARVGKNGLRPLLDRRSGDGTTPAGAFPLGSVVAWDGQVFQFFGNRPDPGVRGAYRDVRVEDCWGATPNAASYQHVVDEPGCASPDEWLSRFGDVYEHAAVIGANLTPISGDAPGEPAFAAAIFLHRNAYSSGGSSNPTSGCVSVAEDDLDLAVRLIDPSLDVRFAIGEVSWLRQSA